MAAPFGIQTRQKSDELFSTTAPLGAGGTLQSPVREVSGYSAVSLFGFSNQAFSVKIEESCFGGRPLRGDLHRVVVRHRVAPEDLLEGLPVREAHEDDAHQHGGPAVATAVLRPGASDHIGGEA
jgi:hypothetical protein